MTKKWSDLKVGDKVIAIEDGMYVTKGKIYPVTRVGERFIDFINDRGNGHSASEDWILIPYEEKGDDIMTKSNAGTLEVTVEEKTTTTGIHAGQVRMDEDGAVILVIYAVAGFDYADEAGMYNTVILRCPYGDIDYMLNMPYRNQHASDIEKEFPLVVNAKLHVSPIN